MSTSELTRLRNIGPRTAGWLEAMGIGGRGDLERIGAIDVYRMLTAAGFGTSLNLLYALEGALRDLPWDGLPEALKRELRREVAE